MIYFKKLKFLFFRFMGKNVHVLYIVYDCFWTLLLKKVGRELESSHFKNT